MSINFSVSVCVCTYNGAKYLRDQLDSILQQTLKPVEVIICDDCSSDGTVSILNEYKDKDPSIKLRLNQVRLGFNKNFEQALRLAKSDYIAISDQDDVWVNTKLELLSNGFLENSFVVYSNSVRFVDCIENASKSNSNYRRVQGSDIRRLFLYNTVSGHAIMLKKEFLNIILPFPEKGYYDWWIAMIGCCHGGLSYVDKVLVYQRNHGDNQSIRNRPKDELSLEYKMELLQQIATIRDVPNIQMRDYLLAQRLDQGIKEAVRNKRSFMLFFTVLCNSRYFFYKKKRIVPIITWIKSTCQFALYESR